METLTEKIIRHLKEPREIDWRTLKSGMRQTLLEMERRVSRINPKAEFSWETDQDFLNIDGLDLVSYTFRNGYRFNPRHATFVTFPEDSDLVICVTENKQGETTNEFVQYIPDAIGSFTGPTFLSSELIPNNGFFYWPKDVKEYPGVAKPFADTYPSGRRRGALAQRHTGEVDLLDDATKWEIIREYEDGELIAAQPELDGPHPVYAALVGTGFYFNSEEPLPEDQHDDNLLINQRSYVIQDESQRLTHAVFHHHISRADAHGVIQHWARVAEVDGWRANELEYFGANTVVVNPETQYPHQILEGGYNRRDHYVMVRDK